MHRVIAAAGAMKRLKDPNVRAENMLERAVQAAQRADTDTLRSIMPTLKVRKSEGECCDTSGESLLHIVARCTSSSAPECLRFLSSFFSVDAANASGSTPLHVAAASGSVANVKTLLECGHDVASIDESGRTPLFHAAESGSEKLLKLLLQWGGSLNDSDSYGVTPMDVLSKSLRLVIDSWVLPLPLLGSEKESEFVEDMLDNGTLLKGEIVHGEWNRRSGPTRTNTAVAGVGIRCHNDDGVCIVVGMRKDGSAQRSGVLRVGDAIVQVDGRSTVGCSVEDVGDRLLGPSGSNVSVDIVRGSAVALVRSGVGRKMWSANVRSVALEREDWGSAEVQTMAQGLTMRKFQKGGRKAPHTRVVRMVVVGGQLTAEWEGKSTPVLQWERGLGSEVAAKWAVAQDMYHGLVARLICAPHGEAVYFAANNAEELEIFMDAAELLSATVRRSNVR